MLETVLGFCENAIQECREICILSTDVSHRLMRQLKKDYPRQVIDVGICEQTAFGVAAGLSLKGITPIIFGPAAFIMTRGYEQVKISLALQNLSAIIVGFGSGLSWVNYGATHCGIDDISLANSICGVVAWEPYDKQNCLEVMNDTIKDNKIHYVRLSEYNKIANIRAIKHKSFSIINESNYKEYLVVFVGSATQHYDETIEYICKERNDVTAAILFTTNFQRNLDLCQFASLHNKLILVEHNVYAGSFSCILMRYLYENGYRGTVKPLCIQSQVGKAHNITGELALQGLSSSDILSEL